MGHSMTVFQLHISSVNVRNVNLTVDGKKRSQPIIKTLQQNLSLFRDQRDIYFALVTKGLNETRPNGNLSLAENLYSSGDPVFKCLYETESVCNGKKISVACRIVIGRFHCIRTFYYRDRAQQQNICVIAGLRFKVRT